MSDAATDKTCLGDTSIKVMAPTLVKDVSPRCLAVTNSSAIFPFLSISMFAWAIK